VDVLETNSKLVTPDLHRNGATLVGDIGGTNARFGWYGRDGHQITRTATYACRDHDSIEDAIALYLNSANVDAPARFALGVASPITGDVVKMTNHHWVISVPSLKSRFRVGDGVLINDFVALASAVPALRAEHLRPLGPRIAGTRAPIGVLGPGTGLGVASLVPVGESDYLPIAGEGGHVTLAASTVREADVLAALREHYSHASAERAVSGPGLQAIYESLLLVDKQTKPQLSPEQIGRLAIEQKDRYCVEAVELLTSFLGNVAGNLALTLGAFGGIFIGGGIVAKLGTAFDERLFREKFEDKGRFASYLQRIPTQLITHDAPALLGAAIYADRTFGPAR
jgi:glucokinase